MSFHSSPPRVRYGKQEKWSLNTDRHVPLNPKADDDDEAALVTASAQPSSRIGKDPNSKACGRRKTGSDYNTFWVPSVTLFPLSIFQPPKCRASAFPHINAMCVSIRTSALTAHHSPREARASQDGGQHMTTTPLQHSACGRVRTRGWGRERRSPPQSATTSHHFRPRFLCVHQHPIANGQTE